MHFASPSRRGLGLLAASTIGMSTAVLGVTGVASAAPEEVTAEATTAPYVVPAGVCSVRWAVVGGLGDTASGYNAGLAGAVVTTTPVTAGQTYTLTGGDASSGPGVGGEDSSVTGPGGFAITAKGGTGSSTARAANTVSGPAATSLEPADAYDGEDDGTFATTLAGAGVALAVPVACPDAPTTVYTGAGLAQASIRFTPGDDDPDEPLYDNPTYQVSVDGGSWQTVSTTAAEQYSSDLRATVTGLTNGTTYSLRVRSVTTAGVSLPSAAATATPFVPVGTPGSPSIVAGPSSILVSWTASSAGTFPVENYDVYLSGGESGGNACRTTAAVHSCLIAVAPGIEYSAVVVPGDTQGNVGQESARVFSGVVPGPTVPASVPTRDDGDITGPSGPITTVTAGRTLTLQGSGFLPGSTVQLTVFSTPVSLGTVVTDNSGAFSVQVTVPAGLANGTHNLVATGIAPDGTTRNLVISVTVSGGTVVRTGLATTGFETSTPLAAGGLALLAGTGLLVGARRRRSN